MVFAKICACFINLVILIFGIASMIFALSMVLDNPIFTTEEGSVKLRILQKADIVLAVSSLIVSGGMIACSILGIIGTVLSSQNSIKLSLYGFIIVLLVSILSIVYLVYKLYTIRTEIVDEMLEALKMYEKFNGTRKILDEFQEMYQCCGIDSFKDWDDMIGYIPHSCCGMKFSVSIKCDEAEVRHKPGCYDQFKEIFSKKYDFSVTLAGAILLIFAIYFLYFIKEEDEDTFGE